MKNYALSLLLSCLAICTNAQTQILQQHLQAGDFFKLRDELVKQQSTLDLPTRLYYASFTDNAFNRNELALKRADSFFNITRAQWPQVYNLRLQETMLDAFVKTGRYRDADDISGIILQQYKPDARAGLENARKIWAALRNVPRQTCTIAESFSIPIRHNNIGLWDIDVQFAVSPELFLFDTGANVSTISESFAEKLGLKLIDMAVNVNSGQGKKVRSSLAVADSLRIGGAMLRHVVFLVMPDDKLNFPQIDFRINGIIGYPVIAALREVHISNKGILSVPATPNNTPMQNLALSQSTPLIQTRSKSDTLIFRFDTGAAYTALFSNYLKKYRQQVLNNSRPEKKKIMSVGGAKNIDTYTLFDLPLTIGGHQLQLHNISVYADEVHDAGRGIVMGNMGQDVIAMFSELTINFEQMYIDFK